MALYNRYRPNTLEEIQGNTTAKRALQSIIERGQIPHAILFQGPRGCGKTTLARILANALECSKQDLQELDIGSFTGVDHSRQLKRSVMMRPINGPVRVWIMDEIANATKQAQEAILKTLEEPPKYAYFFLCTTDPQKLKSTIRSRCTPISVAPLNEKQTIRFLKGICKSEEIDVPNKVLREIYNASLGHPRDALSILETIIGLDPEDMQGVALEEATKRNEAIELCRAIWAKKSWKEVATLIKNIEEEPETVRRIMCGYFTTILLSGNLAAAIVLEAFEKKPFYDTPKPSLVLASFAALSDLKG